MQEDPRQEWPDRQFGFFRSGWPHRPSTCGLEYPPPVIRWPRSSRFSCWFSACRRWSQSSYGASRAPHRPPTSPPKVIKEIKSGSGQASQLSQTILDCISLQSTPRGADVLADNSFRKPPIHRLNPHRVVWHGIEVEFVSMEVGKSE